MEGTSREGNTLRTVFNPTGENLRSKVLEVTWLGDATGLVETIHICYLDDVSERKWERYYLGR